MVEFKQIIGRGTRLYDGKEYFIIFDVVKAHELFEDPQWDGDPLAPDPKPAFRHTTLTRKRTFWTLSSRNTSSLALPNLMPKNRIR